MGVPMLFLFSFSRIDFESFYRVQYECKCFDGALFVIFVSFVANDSLLHISSGHHLRHPAVARHVVGNLEDQCC